MRLAVFLCALLVSCGGGGGQSRPVAIPLFDAPVGVALFSQAEALPVLIHDPGNELGLPHDVGFVVTFDLGAAPISKDDRGVGLYNNSWTAPPNSKPIKTMNFAWLPSMAIHPWAGGKDAMVCTRFQAAIPEVRQQGSLGAYTGADIWLVDGSTGKATSGKQIIMSGFFFVDGGQATDGGPYDYIVALNAVQFRGPVGASQIFTTVAGSLRTQPWEEPVDFGYCLSRGQVISMFAKSAGLLGGTVDIQDVVIHQALLSNETNLGVPSSPDIKAVGALLTTFYRNWVISITAP